MADYNFKAQVLASDLPQKVNQIEKAIFAHDWLEETGEIIPSTLDYDTALKLRCFLLQQDEKAYNEALKINRARYKRISRLQKKIGSMLRQSDTVIFVTLTFSDETLQNTTKETRRRYVASYLSQFSDNYVANIDFGAKNKREHYHAVIDTEIDLKLWQQNGHILAEYVQALDDRKKRKTVPKRYANLTPEEQALKMAIDDEKRLSKYIAKLTNHAIKETAKGSRIIYGRKPKQLSEPKLSNDDLGYIHVKNGKITLLTPTSEQLPF